MWLAAIFFALPASALLVRLLLGVHIAAGSIALLAGLVPILGRKGGRWHVRAGRLYTACMGVVAATAVALSAVQPLTQGRLFLAGVAVLSFYLGFTGWRAARRHSAAPTTLDKALAAGALVVGVVMISAGLRLPAILSAFFGGILCLFAGLDTWQAVSFRFAAPPHPWMLRHFTRLGGSYISATTAFIVVNLGRWLPADSPAWLGLAGWLLPTFIGSYLIARTVRQRRAQLPVS
ncbi:DUF2306 domain-containing protein [Hymenobacter weizhouensis]|uniref:DUF2306 domain-containing protein n=1 Tax=Hymenobacter sp. YIM 151500-1 TaxID=2987689 RepID=UPI002227816B|nr:DUF2306 domain-containing protein [Hymenobacter sp. YIM 151500-1]UYZ63659.1 DUF2306 domain-containing protein [Hymenobacter sp. YIM 151500-1]